MARRTVAAGPMRWDLMSHGFAVRSDALPTYARCTEPDVVAVTASGFSEYATGSSNWACPSVPAVRWIPAQLADEVLMSSMWARSRSSRRSFEFEAVLHAAVDLCHGPTPVSSKLPARMVVMASINETDVRGGRDE
jgi:hypothetical protein